MLSSAVGTRRAGSSRARGAAVAAVAALSLVLVGCSSNNSTGGAGATTGSTQPPANSAAAPTGESPAPSGATGPLTTVTYGTVTPTANTINIDVAIDEGFFTKRGINIQIKSLSNATTVMNALGQDYDIATGFAPAEITASNQGLKLKIIAGGAYDSADHPGTSVVVAANSGISSLGDLAGKTVGCVGLTNAIWQGFQYDLAQQKVDASKVKGVVVPSAAQQAQLAAGQIQAAVGTQPFITQMTGAGMKDLGDPLRAVGDKVALTNFVATTDWANAHPDLVKSIREALDEANQWIVANPDKLVPILVKYTGQDEAASKAAPLPGYETTFTQDDFNQWVKVLTTVVPDFKTTLTYDQLTAPGLSS